MSGYKNFKSKQELRDAALLDRHWYPTNPESRTYQQTVRRSFTLIGVGLHSGEWETVRVCPARAGEGRYFVRVPPGTIPETAADDVEGGAFAREGLTEEETEDMLYEQLRSMLNGEDDDAAERAAEEDVDAHEGPLKGTTAKFLGKTSTRGQLIVRDHHNSGKLLADFARHDKAVTADLTLPEVAAIRLYTGPAFMPINRALHTATLLDDGRVAVCGGAQGLLTTPVSIADVHVFNPASNSWSGAPALTGPRASHTARLLPDGTLALFGGQGASATLSSVETLRF